MKRARRNEVKGRGGSKSWSKALLNDAALFGLIETNMKEASRGAPPAAAAHPAAHTSSHRHWTPCQPVTAAQGTSPCCCQHWMALLLGLNNTHTHTHNGFKKAATT